MLEKYIDLLLKKCLKIKSGQPLLIYYDKENQYIINKIKEKAKSYGVDDVYEDCVDSYKNHEVLKSIDINEIENNELFNKTIWDDYAKKNAAFLMLKGEMPGLMDDIDSSKKREVVKVSLKTKKLYRKLQSASKIAWCIATLPTERWAKKLFPNDKDAYNKLFSYIYKICMIDQDDPIKCWDEQIKKMQSICDKINNLNLQELHYTNDLGTDLYIGLTDNYHFASAGDNEYINNMPSYEIFSSPHYLKTNGKVYSSLPLIYSGSYIKDFYLEFKDGKVINYDAKKGKETLKDILESEKEMYYLGEVALVNNNSPIARTKKIFETTLYDENASCHLALGDSFPECYENGLEMKREELKDKGLNICKNHVDFMIGTKDLNIVGITKDNEKIQIFENGNFVI